MRSRRVRLIAAFVVAFALAASFATAQRRRGGGRRGRGGPGFSLTGEADTINRYAKVDDFDGAYQFCRLVTPESAYGDGAGEMVDYPRADINLSIRFSELTRVSASTDEAGDPRPVVVRLDQPDTLFKCPMIMLTEPGRAVIDGNDAKVMREYLLKGGFFWADDYWSQYAWDFFEDQIRHVFPEAQTYPIVDLPRSHPLFTMVYDATKVPQIPGIGYWDGAQRTWERSPAENRPHIRAIFDEKGRMMVLFTHDTDFGDSYEEEASNPDYFVMFSAPGYAFGIDAIVYAMTH
jgi:hypothetical protein